MRTTFASLVLGILSLMATTQHGTGASMDSFDKTLETLTHSNDQLERFTLPNGMTCLLKADNTAPVVSIQFWVGTGSIHEQEYLGAGLSHAIEHMIFKGTPTRAPGDISQEINDIGGRINAYTTLDRVVFHTDLPSRHWRVGFDALADSVMHANFPADEWQQERKVILREFAMGKDDPNRVMNKILWRTAFNKHPYRVPVIGYEDIFNTITRDDLELFFKRHYISDNMILVIVGDIDPHAVRAIIEETFEPFVRRKREPVILPREPRQLAPRIARETGPYNVTRLQWAYPGVSLDHPDAAALDVLANIAGHGNSSRFAKSLVEEKQLAHEVSVWSYSPGQPGLFGISATCDPDKEEALLHAIEAEITTLRDSTFSNKELQKATRGVLTSELSALATMNGQAASYGSGEFFAGDPRFSETYIRQLQSVTPESLQRVAKLYLNHNTRSLVLLSPELAAEAKTDTNAKIESSVPHRITLNNGIRLIAREDHKLPFVYLTVALRGGLLSENESNVGITALMSECLLRGTQSKTREQISETIEDLGGHLSAYSGNNAFGLQAKCLSSDLDIVSELLADCLLNPSFPEAELEKERTLQTAAIQKQEERPMFLAQQALRKAIFANHPYQWDRHGTVDSIEGITRKQIQEHHAKHVVSQNLVISIFGDISQTEATERAQKLFADTRPGTVAAQSHADTAPELPIRIVQEVPQKQAIVLVGFPAVSIFDPRNDALNLLQTAMSGLSSDLAISVRDKRGLAYYVGAYQQPGVDPGMFVIYAGTQRASADAVEALYKEEIKRITTEGLRNDEVDAAKNRIIADHDMQLQNNLHVALTCGLNELYGLGFDYAFSTAARINALTAKTVREASESILNTNNMAVSVLLPEVGPEDK